jgi:hypothetical protein
VAYEPDSPDSPGSPPQPPAKPTPSAGGPWTPTVAQLRQYAVEQQWPEDFKRFDDNTVQDWLNNYWDPNARKFKSAKTGMDGKPVEGRFFKPDDCPEGTQAWGSNQCRDSREVEAIEAGRNPPGGPGTQAPPGDGLLHAPAPSAVNPMMDLQQALEDRFLGREGFFGFADSRDPMSGIAGDIHAKSLGGGGLWWGGDKGMFDNTLVDVPSPVQQPAPQPPASTAPLPGVNSPPPIVQPGGELGVVPGVPSGVGTGDEFGGSLEDQLFGKFQRKGKQQQQPWWRAGVTGL